MRRALELARHGTALTSPNPQVGAVVVREGRVIGTGWYDYAGRTHAEVKALREAGAGARGATLYINLEPCSHTGRTPPCADAVVAAGIKRVVAAMADPNPKVNGAGLERLRQADIIVEVGCLRHEAERLNERFTKWIVSGTPFVLLKTAMSLDARIARCARKQNEPDWITAEPARLDVQRLRHEYDAVLVGVGTVIADNPLLTDRTNQSRRRPLLRVVLDTHLRLPVESRLVATADEDVVVFCATEAAEPKRADLEDSGVRVCSVPAGGEGVDITAVFRQLGDAEITSVIVEGGSRINASVVAHRLLDKLALYVAPTLLGSCGSVPFIARSSAVRELNLREATARAIGTDLLIEAYPETAPSPQAPQN
jgi:diaminohydroxyphosphoribosylaminopyrimidine deaminase/5-amino-6-(5-phosphoribosylamino)uracil reductase